MAQNYCYAIITPRVGQAMYDSNNTVFWFKFGDSHTPDRDLLQYPTYNPSAYSRARDVTGVPQFDDNGNPTATMPWGTFLKRKVFGARHFESPEVGQDHNDTEWYAVYNHPNFATVLQFVTNWQTGNLRYNLNTAPGQNAFFADVFANVFPGGCAVRH